jgi:hypothetical protein
MDTACRCRQTPYFSPPVRLGRAGGVAALLAAHSLSTNGQNVAERQRELDPSSARALANPKFRTDGHDAGTRMKRMGRRVIAGRAGTRTPVRQYPSTHDGSVETRDQPNRSAPVQTARDLPPPACSFGLGLARPHFIKFDSKQKTKLEVVYEEIMRHLSRKLPKPKWRVVYDAPFPRESAVAFRADLT